MNLIQPSVEIIKQEPGIEGIYKAIELAGRTCYKSDDKITDTSAKEFVDRMIKSGHFAMLEFGTVYLKQECNGLMNQINPLFDKYKSNKYSKVMYKIEPMYDFFYTIAYITTNYRVLVENGWLDDLKYMCEPTKYHDKRICAKFITDRGVSHELVRHRVFSFAQESTRYCNYSKDKFGKELTYIIPEWSNLEQCEIDAYLMSGEELNKPANKKHSSLYFIQALANSECCYFNLLESGCTPQEARQVLPNALKTEINMCGFESDWAGFFKLRCDNAAHPDMRKVATELRNKMNKDTLNDNLADNV